MRASEVELVDVLDRALPSGAIRLLRTGDGKAGDLMAELPDGSSVLLDLEWAGRGFPRDVERILFRRTRGSRSDTTRQLIVCARVFSSGAQRLLAEEGVSWVALDGAASLHIGTVWVERDGGGPLPEPDRDATWSPGTGDVAEVLLAVVADGAVWPDGRHRVPDVSTLAALSGRALGTVANTLADLDRRGWTAPGPEGRSRVLADPVAMFESWADWERRRRHRWDAFHVLSRDPAEIEHQLRAVFGADLIVAGTAVSERVAPFLTNTPVVHAYVDGPWSEIDERVTGAQMLPAPNGRVRLAAAPEPVRRTSQIVHGVRGTSAVRTYVDLLRGTDREQDAAETFRSAALRVFT